MSQPNYAYVEVTIGDKFISATDTDTSISLTVSKESGSYAGNYSLEFYDHDGTMIEPLLKGHNVEVDLQYGWSNGKSSPRFLGLLDSYRLVPVSPEGDTQITLEVLGNGTKSAISNSTTSYDDSERISEIVEVIARRNNWEIGHIEETRIIYEDSDNSRLKRYVQSNMTDEEFLTALCREAISSDTGKGNYVFKIPDPGNPSSRFYFQPRDLSIDHPKEVITTDSSGSTLSPHASPKYYEEPGAGSPGSSVLPTTGSRHFEFDYNDPDGGVRSVQLTNLYGVASTMIGDGYSTEYSDSGTNEYVISETSGVATNKQSVGNPTFTPPNNPNKAVESYLNNHIRDNTSIGEVFDLQFNPPLPMDPPFTLSGGDGKPLGRSGSPMDQFMLKILSMNGKPYVFGAHSDRAADCSGLISLGMRHAGLAPAGWRFSTSDIPAGRVPQFQMISKSQLQLGDIVYRSGHVEVYIDSTTTFAALSESEGIRYRSYPPGGINSEYTSAYRIRNAGRMSPNTRNLALSQSRVNSRSLSASSSTPSEMEALQGSNVDMWKDAVWELQLTIDGDPTIDVLDDVTFNFYTRDGKSHISSGDYKVSKVVDTVTSSGDFSTTLTLMSPGALATVSNSSYSSIGGSASSGHITEDPISQGNNGVPYMCQQDSAWGGSSGLNIAQSGCGPTSLAMVFSYYGKNTTPVEVANKLGSRYSPSDGLGATHFEYIANEYNLNYDIVYTKEDIDSELRKGFPVIMHVEAGNKYWSSGGHYIVVTGIDSSGNYLVNDPWSRAKSKTKHSRSDTYSGMTFGGVVRPRR